MLNNSYDYLYSSDPTCTGTVRGSARLVGGTAMTLGRVELCNTAGFRRGVCDDGWDDNDAMVVCRELGYLMDGISVFHCVKYCLDWLPHARMSIRGRVIALSVEMFLCLWTHELYLQRMSRKCENISFYVPHNRE